MAKPAGCFLRIFFFVSLLSLIGMPYYIIVYKPVDDFIYYYFSKQIEITDKNFDSGIKKINI